MDKRINLGKLENLFNQPEVKNGFSSQQAGVSWANEVAPLLRFNDDYYQSFIHHLHIINQNVSSYTLEPAFRTMVSQVEMAIQQLRLAIAHEGNNSEQELRSKDRTDVIDLKPNFYGIGLNLNEGLRRLKKWFREKL